MQWLFFARKFKFLEREKRSHKCSYRKILFLARKFKYLGTYLIVGDKTSKHGNIASGNRCDQHIKSLGDQGDWHKSNRTELTNDHTKSNVIFIIWLQIQCLHFSQETLRKVEITSHLKQSWVLNSECSYHAHLKIYEPSMRLHALIRVLRQPAKLKLKNQFLCQLFPPCKFFFALLNTLQNFATVIFHNTIYFIRTVSKFQKVV